VAEVAGHLSVAELGERFRAAADARSARHVQAIWLLAKGHAAAEVAATTAFGVRWVEKLLARYNAGGPDALGDLRRRNGTRATILKPELLDKLRARLADPPPDGGLWSSRKAATWMAGELGLGSVAVQRGWEALRALGWSVQVPRPEHPERATAEEQEAFKKAQFALAVAVDRAAARSQVLEALGSAARSSVRRQPRWFAR
jgi:transposase